MQDIYATGAEDQSMVEDSKKMKSNYDVCILKLQKCPSCLACIQIKFYILYTSLYTARPVLFYAPTSCRRLQLLVLFKHGNDLALDLSHQLVGLLGQRQRQDGVR